MKVLPRTGHGLSTLLTLVAALGVAGCGGREDLDDLRAFTRDAFKDVAPKVEPLPEMEPYEIFLYSGESFTEPFLALNLRRTEAVVERSDEAVFQPERRREVLEQFPLDSLRMLGTMNRDGDFWALIGAPDGGIHTVTTGTHLGFQSGKIIGITEQEVAIREVVKGASGEWEERGASLKLQE